MTKIGSCSLCLGPVTVPMIWYGIVPPTPTCSKCGAIAAPAGPVIPMIQPTRPPRLPWTQPLWRDTPQPTVPWGPPLAEDPFPEPPAFPDLPPWGSSGDVWCAVDHTVRHNVEWRS